VRVIKAEPDGQGSPVESQEWWYLVEQREGGAKVKSSGRHTELE